VDDADEDVTYVVQELRAAGVEVRLDREVLVPGRRLWNQIGDEIEDPKCDGWIVFATRAAFESEAVMEEPRVVSSFERDELSESFDRCLPLQGFAGSVVELGGDGVEVGLGVDREVGSFGEELADQPVPVLVAASLPRRVRVTEIHWDPGSDGEQQVVS
jgi:hypothetical protein